MRDLIPNSSDESETERSGLFSTRREVHAFAVGLYDGMRTWRLRPNGLPDNEDAQAEPHYYKAGYVIGTLLQAAIGIVSLSTLFS